MKDNPFERIIRSSKVQTAVLAVVTSLMVVFGIDPKRQAEILLLVGGIFTLATAVILAIGYEDGKANETTGTGIGNTRGDVHVNIGGQPVDATAAPPAPPDDGIGDGQ